MLLALERKAARMRKHEEKVAADATRKAAAADKQQQASDIDEINKMFE